MPTEVTPAPFKYAQMLPTGLEYQDALRGSHAREGWASLPPLGPASLPSLIPGIPPSGPARASECMSIQRGGRGDILPNGMRNPWAPNAREACDPASEAYGPSAVAASPAGAYGLASQFGALSLAGGGGPGGGGGSAIVPRSRAMSFAGSGYGSGYGGGWGERGGSIYPAHHVPIGGLGGTRPDDGWTGAAGRAHHGHAPDMASTVGGTPRLTTANASSSDWLHAPASYLNHAPMSRIAESASYAGSAAPVPISIPSSQGAYLLPPSTDYHHSHHHQQQQQAHHHPHHGTGHRTSSSPSSAVPRRIPIQPCEECDRERERDRAGQQHHKRLGNSPAVSSPLRPAPAPHGDLLPTHTTHHHLNQHGGGAPLARNSSRRSHGTAGGSGRREREREDRESCSCSECSSRSRSHSRSGSRGHSH